MSTLPRTERLSYILAVIAVGIAFGARCLLEPWVPSAYTFWFFVPAVAIAAWSGGLAPGFFGAALSIGAGLGWMRLQTGVIPTDEDKTAIILFSISCLTVLGAVQGLRRNLRKEIVSRPVVEAVQTPLRREVERDRNFKSIFDNTLDAAIIVLDAHRIVREWNVGATNLTGWSRGEMLGRSADALFTLDDQQNGEPGLEQLMAETSGKGTVSRWLVKKDGTQFLAEGSLRSLPGELNEPPGFIKFFTDVTPRVQKYEDSLANMVTRAQDAELLTYMIAHDMRQYTRGISTNTTMLTRDLDSIIPEDYKGILARLKDNALRMHQMVDGLLEHLRVGRSPTVFEPVNLSAIAESAALHVKGAMPESKVHFIVQPGLWVKGDKEMLALVFGNLFENACKYAPEGRVIFGHDAAKDAYFVRDEGPGFEPQYSQKIFELFKRLHGQEIPGTGIGLSNVKRIIVERHGGKIWAESEPGKGATFYFTLKAAELSPVGSIR